MKKLFLLFVAFSMLYQSNAQKMWGVPETPNQPSAYSGDLATGFPLASLDWASTSSMACWPATENTYFNGNHVFYITTIPAHAELTVTLYPDNPSDNMSIYGYQVGKDNNLMPPNISTCVACESERKWERERVGKTQDHTRSIYFNSTTSDYKIVIGVVGANSLKSGTFKLKFDLKAELSNNNPQEKVVAKQISLSANGSSLKGNLNEGIFMQDLSWASKSSMACFPATQNTKFRGKHVLYQTTVPANMNIKVTVIPDNKNANMSVYTILDGVNNTALPPEIASCSSCEAEHKWDYAKVNKTQDHTRWIEFDSYGGTYRLVIGVAGADGLDSGGYTLKIELSPMQ
jgi:hypothetical protein